MVSFPDASMVVDMHDRMIEKIGGSPGIRDYGLLEGAIGRGQMAVDYGGADSVEAACKVAEGICQSHPFVDGNKRAALISLRVILVMNGLSFEPPHHDVVQMMVGVASHTLEGEVFQAWVRDNVHPCQALVDLFEYDLAVEAETPEDDSPTP
jgi:death-on-curing protein